MPHTYGLGHHSKSICSTGDKYMEQRQTCHKPSIRIATWPVNGINKRLQYLVHWLESRKPDIVALQKIRGSVETFPARKLCCVGYSSIVFPPSFRHVFGVAILVRSPSSGPKVLEWGLPDRPHDGARLLTKEICNLFFSSIYIPAKKQKRIACLRDFTEYVDSYLDPEKRVVLCGEFNVNEKLATMEEQQLLASLADAGYKDLYQSLRPHEDGFNFGKSRFGPVTARLNRILGTQKITDNLRDVWVDSKYRGPIPRLKNGGWTLSAPLLVDLGRHG